MRMSLVSRKWVLWVALAVFITPLNAPVSAAQAKWCCKKLCPHSKKTVTPKKCPEHQEPSSQAPAPSSDCCGADCLNPLSSATLPFQGSKVSPPSSSDLDKLAGSPASSLSLFTPPLSLSGHYYKRKPAFLPFKTDLFITHLALLL